MARDLTSGDIVSATPHYNQDLSLPEPIDVIRSVPFNVGNTYKYMARADHKGTAIQDVSKAAWYACDIAATLFLELTDGEEDFLFDGVLHNGASWRSFVPQGFFSFKEKLERAQVVYGSHTYSRMALAEAEALLAFYASSMLNVTNRAFYRAVREVALQRLATLITLIYQSQHDKSDKLKPLPALYLGTRGQKVPSALFDYLFSGNTLVTGTPT
jgi:hypothetical protein